MRIAGFSLGTRYTIDDFDMASDIIKGSVRISLGSLEDSEEAKETRSAILDMVEELRGNNSGGIAESVVESVNLGENSEVKTSQHNSSENDVVTVAEFSTMGEHIPQGLTNIDIEEENDVTDEEDDYFGDMDDELEDSGDGYFDDDTSVEEENAFENKTEVYGDDDDEDDYDFGDIDSTEQDDEDADEDYIDPIDAEIQRILGSQGATEVKKPTDKVVNKPQVSKPTTNINTSVNQGIKKPAPINNTQTGVKPRQPQVGAIDSSSKHQPIKKAPVNNSGAQHTVKKPINTVKQPIKKEAAKPDYISIPIKEVYTKYVKAFMIKNGVQRGVVDAKLLTNEFGAEIVLKLSRGGYILKRGSGYTMGL